MEGSGGSCDQQEHSEVSADGRPGADRLQVRALGSLRGHEEGLRAAGVVLTRLLLGEAPDDAVKAHLGGRLIAMRKPNGKLRPLACGSALRRLAAKGVCQVMADDLRRAGGERQFGIGRKAGTEVMHKVLTTLAEARPRHAFVSFDARNAFNAMHRSAVLRAVSGSPLGRVAAAWYGRGTLHRYWDTQGRMWKVRSERGLDQGCPLSPALFSAALAPCLVNLQDRLRRLDARAEVFAYLDDIFVVVEASHACTAAEVVTEVLGGVGLSLEPSKTKVWTPDAETTLPAGAADWRVQQLSCLGNTLPFVEASRDLSQEADEAARVPVGSAAAPGAVKAALAGLTERLRDLQGKGLRKQSAWVLFRTYVNGASNHVLRACWASSEWCQQYDAAVIAFIEDLLGVSLESGQREQVWLSLKHGGLGLGSASMRRSAAYLASWDQCFGEVARSQGVASAQALLGQAPKLRVWT